MKMRKILILFVFFVLAIFFGCKDKGVLPERLLTEQEMIDIMTDVQIIEADINYRKTQETNTDTVPIDYKALSQSYYTQLFDHYGITDSVFSQNMLYYTEHPAQLEKIMDSVLQRLVKGQATND